MANINTIPKAEKATLETTEETKRQEAEALDPSVARARATIAQQREAAAQLERTTGRSGAIPLAPKETLLNAKDVEALHPDKRLRWCNLRDPNKIASRQVNGYVRLSESEGGRQLGDEYALFAIPRDQYDATVERQQQLNRRRLMAHVEEASTMAEGFAKMMRDQYGIKVDPKKLIFSE